MGIDGGRSGASAALIAEGKAVLGIEFGSTRIKGALIAPDGKSLASGSYEWENQLKDGVWTYGLDEIWKGLSGCYSSLAADVKAKYEVELRGPGGHGHKRHDARLHGLGRVGEAPRSLPDLAQ